MPGNVVVFSRGDGLSLGLHGFFSFLPRFCHRRRAPYQRRACGTEAKIPVASIIDLRRALYQDLQVKRA